MGILNTQKTLVKGIEKAKENGYRFVFRFQDSKLIDRESNQEYGCEDCTIDESFRFEGMTNPGDSSILFLISCADGKKGYITSAYGTYANPQLMEFLMKLENKSTH